MDQQDHLTHNEWIEKQVSLQGMANGMGLLAAGGFRSLYFGSLHS
jgi:hypothetical protein